MKRVYTTWRLQEKAARKIIKAVNGREGIEFEDPIIYELFSIALSDKKAYCYEQDLHIFKMLFNDPHKDYKKELWNSLCPKEYGEEWDAADFTPEELEFLEDFQEHSDNRLYCDLENPSEGFSTKRLIIRPPGPKDEKIFFKHLRTEGDFTVYTGRKYNRANLYASTLSRPLIFSVFEKESGNMVGVVGLHDYDRDRRRADAEWYIFRSFRNRGYAGEAFTALAERAFEGKLAVLTETSWLYKYRKHYVKLDFISAVIQVSNLLSQKTAESCGFEKRYIDRNYFYIENKHPADAVVYELTPDK